jgi:phosphoglycolate phosphatase-like HAD superfamily hydrolase
MAPRRRIEGVLLDVDGTLVDSNDAHARAWSEALADIGRQVPATRIRPLIGMGGDKLLPAVGVDPESSEGKSVSERRSRIFLERHVPLLKATRGARELVARFRREGFKLVVATSAREDEVEAILRHIGLEELIARKTSADDAEHSKPDPDIIHAALETANVAPASALLLGDTPYDIEAAKRANVDCVALLCGGWDADALQNAIAIYEDPADLVKHFTASPFASAA